MRMAAVLTLVATVMFAGACSEPTQPTQVPPQAQAQRVVSQIRGRVADTAFRNLAEAKIEIVNGPNAGMFAISDQFGHFSFSGVFSGALTFRATKQGYVTATQVLDVPALCLRCDATIAFGMDSPDTILRLEPGDYALTFIADPSCTRLPPELRTRTYAATITASSAYPGSYNVRVPGMLFEHGWFAIGISGNYLATEDDSYPTFFEPLPQSTYLGIDFQIGTMNFQVVNASEISVPFPGSFEYCRVTSGTVPNFCDFFPPTSVVAHEVCNATNNQMILVRQ